MMKIYFRLMFFVLLAQFMPGRSHAHELPAPADLISSYQLKKRDIKVVEPHESTKTRYSYVEYTAVSVDELLTRLFGREWKSEGNQIVFFAKDGYRSAISSAKLTKHQAYLAFARRDGQAFAVDNIELHRKNVELGPYYLIWANLGIQELITYGTYDWPYQVTRIDLQRGAMQDKLRPRQVSEDIEMGMEATGKYCLNCHSIRGIGGRKYPLDLIEASCRWQENDLKALIDAPSVMKPGTAMPALNRMLAADERERVIARIVSYLQALKSGSASPCAIR